MGYKIITEKVFNQATGKLETRDAKVIESKKRSIKGGFMMVYKHYDEILSQMNSKNEIKIMLWVKNQFTNRKYETNLSFLECDVDVSKSTFVKTMKKLLDSKFIMRTGRGIYRMNPFIYLPYMSDGLVLQDEWTELQSEGG